MEKCISESLLIQYLVNELDEDKNESIKVHLTQCTSCQKKLETFSEDSELRKWHECHQRQQSDESPQNHHFSQEKLEKLFDSTISSIMDSKNQSTQDNLPQHSPPPSEETHNLSIGKDLNLNPIKTIGQYLIVKKIGQGGMGIVYLAIHSRLKKRVVLKLLLNKGWENANQTQRFYREMELVGQLDHPNIVKATDAGEVDETGYLVMEYLEGHDLKTILKSEGSISITAVCSITRQIAYGLQYIHNNKLIHRDIKPSNIFLTKEGQVKILDLGLAGLCRSETSTSDLTDTNCVMGSAHYMAPEQAQNVKTIDQRSDIYSLGCTFYHLLTGQVPFVKETPVETIIAHRAEAAPKLSDQIPDIPEELETLFQSMIKKDPAERIQSMPEIIKVLDQFLTKKLSVPLNDSSDTNFTESQELTRLCRNTSTNPSIENLNQFPSTQAQPQPHFFNLKKTKLLIPASILLTAGLAVFFLLPQILPETPSEPPPTQSKITTGNKESQTQFISERTAALWAINHGCAVTIRLRSGTVKSFVRRVELLPDQEFRITEMIFSEPQHLTQDSLNHLKELSALKVLKLNDCTLDENAMEPIKNLTTLIKLDLRNTGLTDKGLSCVSQLKNLESISLHLNPKLTDDGLQALNPLHALEAVNLAKLNTSDKGLIFIQNNPKIGWLNISKTDVTDESVKHLITLKVLKDLYVKDSSITVMGIEKIRSNFPEWDPVKFD